MTFLEMLGEDEDGEDDTCNTASAPICRLGAEMCLVAFPQDRMEDETKVGMINT